MATAVIVPNPDGEEREPTWESILSEIRTEIQSGFERLCNQIRETMENPQLVQTLTTQNTELVRMISENYQMLLQKVDSLTLQASKPAEIIPVPVPVEVPESVAEESPVVETSPETVVLPEEPPARAKRRTL